MSERDAGRLLIFRVGACVCALPLENVIETMRPLPIEPIAAAPPFVLGLSLIRGGPVPVVDAGKLLTDHDGRPTRFVTIKAGDGTVALAVDDVMGIRAISSDFVRDMPPLLRDASAEVISAVGSLDAELLLVIRGGRLLPSDLMTTPEAVWPTR